MKKNIALVTGGTGAIGTAICRSLANEGYSVTSNCHPNDLSRSEGATETLREENLDVQISAFDVTDFQSCANAIELIESQGNLQVLVNAAGITCDSKIESLTQEDWQSVLSTNLDSVFNTCKHCVPHMKRMKYGRIINISSVNGQKGQFGQTNYSASKAGITGFTKALARETAKYGITANVVSPGYVESPMIDAVPSEIRDKIIEEIPIGRFGKPDEIARVVNFLAHPANGYITGADISINGGYHMG